MFSRISSLFAQAAEVTTQALSGPANREDQLQAHWKNIQEILISDQGGSEEDVLVIQDIEDRLGSISDLIFEEEEERRGNMGPCVEYMLRHKLLDMLVTTAKTNYPAGMRKTVLKFLTVLLGRLDQQLLPHVAVHRPINQLIKTCGLSSVNPLAAEELMFLRMLCVKLQQDSTLANFFTEVKEGDEKSTKFVISEAFMKTTISEDSLVCIKAFECLLVCVAFNDQLVTQAIAHSQLPLLLSSKLKQHLQLVPSSIHYLDIINCKAGWGVNNASTSAVQCLTPSPHTPLLHLEAYLSWMDYCEQVVASSPKLLHDVVCDNIREHVIEGVLQQKLSLSSETDLVVGVAILNQTLNLLTHERLIKEFTDFILNTFWDQLIQCCNHFNEDVCCSSLLLLHTLLTRPPLLSRVLPLAMTPPTPSRFPVTDSFQLEQWVTKYLSLIPNDCISNDSGLTLYLIEAHNQLQKFKCAQLEQHKDSTTPSSTNDEWTEPPLITILLDRLERLLDQNYNVNLHVTSLISHLAIMGGSLDQYLFTPTQSGDHTHRSVYGILSKVREELVAHTVRSPGLGFNITEARRRLNGQETSDLLSMPNNELLEGAIVLEEFVKELAAILFVKYSEVLLQTSPISSVAEASFIT